MPRALGPRLALLAALLAGCASGPAPADDDDASGDPDGPWPGGAPAALSLAFDDGDASHLTHGVDLLEERGVAGTFFLTTAWVTDWDAWTAVASAGHELGSHTVVHPDLTSVSDTQLEDELVASKAAIEAETGASVRSIAYPFAAADGRVVEAARAYYDAGRLAHEGTPWNPAEPADPLQLVSTAPITTTTASDLRAELADAVAAGGWLIVQVHGIEDSASGWEPVPRVAYEQLLDDALQQDVWIAPLIEVVDHIEGRGR